jgi:hypothetical protein
LTDLTCERVTTAAAASEVTVVAVLLIVENVRTGVVVVNLDNARLLHEQAVEDVETVIMGQRNSQISHRRNDVRLAMMARLQKGKFPELFLSGFFEFCRSTNGDDDGLIKIRISSEGEGEKNDMLWSCWNGCLSGLSRFSNNRGSRTPICRSLTRTKIPFLHTISFACKKGVKECWADRSRLMPKPEKLACQLLMMKRAKF